MGYGNNNYRGGGNNGYSRGGGYQNNRGGGGYNRGGGSYGRGGNNFRGGGDGDHKYVKSSSFVWDHIKDSEAKGQAKKDATVPYYVTPGESEEISISLTAQKAQQLLEKIQDAINDQQGDGGIRMTMYVQHKVNKETNEPFDGASILVVGKFPSRNQGGGGYRGEQGRNGRRDYPDRGNANSGMNQGGQRQSGQYQENTTGDRDGNTQNAPNDAYHSNDDQQQYTEKPGW